ncbi:hypothetical protein C8R44DRAFT_755016 [Mycena epipterygia]|nr:hypothetical protein C8R44DRAFT_755016 [Mycena epipterygia]
MPQLFTAATVAGTTDQNQSRSVENYWRPTERRIYRKEKRAQWRTCNRQRDVRKSISTAQLIRTSKASSIYPPSSSTHSAIASLQPRLHYYQLELQFSTGPPLCADRTGHLGHEMNTARRCIVLASNYAVNIGPNSPESVDDLPVQSWMNQTWSIAFRFDLNSLQPEFPPYLTSTVVLMDVRFRLGLRNSWVTLSMRGTSSRFDRNPGKDCNIPLALAEKHKAANQNSQHQTVNNFSFNSLSKPQLVVQNSCEMCSRKPAPPP